MNQSQAKNILEFVSDFQIKAQAIKRYEGNPYVEGDNIAEHLSRLAKLLICIIPDLKKEFSDQSMLIEDIFTCLLVHDDDEVIDGFDIPTALKNHNVKDQEEIIKFNYSVDTLSDDSKNNLISAFSAFRQKTSLAAKIAKALDNITGNQLVIEQKIGLINPDQARFAIEYVEKVKGISQTTDMLIEAQINQVIEYREWLKNNIEESNPNKEKIKSLLNIDIRTHILQKEKINIALEDL